MSAVRPDLWHQPVMGEEVLRHLNPQPGQLVVDGTLGTGGHSLLVLPRLLPEGRLIALDRDRGSLEAARQHLADFEPMILFVHDNYRHLPQLLGRLRIARVDGLFLDLGMSSPQVDQPERGFSFSKEGPLDMRMDPEEETTAESLVSQLAEQELAGLFERLGEERFARRIARSLVEARRRSPITTTMQLSRLIAGAVPPGARRGRLHPATRVFQALRMAVNDELGALEALLAALPTVLKHGGRAVIISYHSLEDRLVKRAFLDGMHAGTWQVLTKKPVRPSAAEVSRNPRARSAKLRAVALSG